MRNIEKFKNNIERAIDVCELYQNVYKIKNRKYPHECCGVCDRCYDDCIRWLAEEAKEPVLDEIERKYLSEVVRPFRKRISYIIKEQSISESSCYIYIACSDGDYISFPYFKENSMYIGMEIDKKYTLKELGL